MLSFILEYVRKHAKALPANRWTATSASGQDVTVLDHKVGVNLSQGPWLKFVIEEGGVKKTITATKRFNGGDRLQYEVPEGGNRECGDDKLDFTASFDGGALVIVKLTFEWPESKGDDEAGPIHHYRFVGRSSDEIPLPGLGG